MKTKQDTVQVTRGPKTSSLYWHYLPAECRHHPNPCGMRGQPESSLGSRLPFCPLLLGRSGSGGAVEQVCVRGRHIAGSGSAVSESRFTQTTGQANSRAGSPPVCNPSEVGDAGRIDSREIGGFPSPHRAQPISHIPMTTCKRAFSAWVEMRPCVTFAL